MNLFYLGTFLSAALPIFVTTDMNSDLKQFTAASETSLNPSPLTVCESPLEGPSAMLLNELTLDIQQFVRTCVSISVKISAMQPTTRVIRFATYQAELGSFIVNIQEALPVGDVLRPKTVGQHRTKSLCFGK